MGLRVSGLRSWEVRDEDKVVSVLNDNSDQLEVVLRLCGFGSATCVCDRLRR